MRQMFLQQSAASAALLMPALKLQRDTCVPLLIDSQFLNETLELFLFCWRNNRFLDSIRINIVCRMV